VKIFSKNCKLRKSHSWEVLIIEAEGV